MKTKELRQLSSEELRVKAEEMRAQIEHMRFNSQKGKEKNVKKLIMVRHELATILTILGEVKPSVTTEQEKKPHSSTK